eukprot:s1513_g1.t1
MKRLFFSLTCESSFAFGQYAKTHIFEEARNGTMSILSELTKAGPALEQEFLRLSKEADERELGCQAPGCSDDHFSNMGTKAADLNRDKAVAAPPPPPQAPEPGPMEAAEADAEPFLGISKRSRKQRARGLAKPKPTPVLLNLWSDRAVFRVLSFGWPSALPCAAAVAPVWAQAVRRFGADEEALRGTEADRIRKGAWRTWLTLLCPGTVEVADLEGEPLPEKLLRHLVCPPRPRDWCISMDWCFLVALWNDGRRLWTGSLTAAHALPFEEEQEDGGPACYERRDEIRPGQAMPPAEMARMTVCATAARGTVLLPVPALLRPGPLDSSESFPRRGGILRVVLGVFVTSKKDTAELRASLGFAGPDGRWLDGRTAMLLLTGLAAERSK